MKPSEHFFVFETFDSYYTQNQVSWTFRYLTLLNTIISKSKNDRLFAVWFLAAFLASE